MSDQGKRPYGDEQIERALLPFYEHQHYHQIERVDALNSRLGFPLTALTFLLGSGIYFAMRLHTVPRGLLGNLFAVLLLALFLASLAAIYYMARTLFHHKGAYMPDLAEVDETVRSIATRNREELESERVDLNQEFTVFLLERYREAASWNAARCRRKSGYFHRTIVALFVAVTLLVLVSGVFFVSAVVAEPGVEEANTSISQEVGRLERHGQEAGDDEEADNGDGEAEEDSVAGGSEVHGS